MLDSSPASVHAPAPPAGAHWRGVAQSLVPFLMVGLVWEAVAHAGLFLRRGTGCEDKARDPQSRQRASRQADFPRDFHRMTSKECELQSHTISDHAVFHAELADADVASSEEKRAKHSGPIRSSANSHPFRVLANVVRIFWQEPTFFYQLREPRVYALLVSVAVFVELHQSVLVRRNPSKIGPPSGIRRSAWTPR